MYQMLLHPMSDVSNAVTPPWVMYQMLLHPMSDV